MKMKVCSLWGVDPHELTEFKNWFKQQKHLPQDTPDEYFAMILHSCYFEMELAKKTIDTYFTLKSNTPEFFTHRTMEDKALQRQLECTAIMCLDGKTKDGYTVVWGCLRNYSPSEFIPENWFRYSTMVVDTILKDNPGCPGIVYVYDNSHATFRHTWKIPLHLQRKYLAYIQAACPARVKGLHVFNAGYVMTQFMSLIRPFIRSELFNKMYFHNAQNLDEIKRISNFEDNIIPEEYGGQGPSIVKLTYDTARNVGKYNDWFAADEKLRIKKK